MLFIICSR